MDRWDGKVAIVTGASSGIGAAIAEKLVEEGLKVVGLARRAEQIEELSEKLSGKKGKLYAKKTDVTCEEEVVEAFKWTTEKIGPISILINSAGIFQHNSLSNGNVEKWRKVFDTNVIGLCIATREAVKSMKQNNIDGHIIHINSIAGQRVQPFTKFNVYPASKFAVTALTEVLRLELNEASSKIKVTSLSPGFVRTEMLSMNLEQPSENLEKAPCLSAEDVANAVAYVLSTPPHVQVHEMVIKPVGEHFL